MNQQGYILILAAAKKVSANTKGKYTIGDLLGAGWEGYHTAKNRVDASKPGATNFLMRRIVGAMIDYLRAQDGRRWVGDKASRKHNAMRNMERLTSALSARAEDSFSRIILRDFIDKKITNKRSKDILWEYFVHGLKLKEIGNRYGITEAAVCRIVNNTLKRLQEE